jgi:hypothetical protein
LKPQDCVLLMTTVQRQKVGSKNLTSANWKIAKSNRRFELRQLKNKPIFSCCWDSNHTVNGSKENVMKLQTLSQGTTIEVTKT